MSIGRRPGARLGYWRTLGLATVAAVWWMVGGGCIQPRSYVSAAERCKAGEPGACSPDVCATFAAGEVPTGCLEDAAGGDLDVASDVAPDGLAKDMVEELGPADTHALDDTPSVADVAADSQVKDGADVAEGDVASDAVPDGSAEDTLEDVASADADAVADMQGDGDVVADGQVEDVADVAEGDVASDAVPDGSAEDTIEDVTLADADAVADTLGDADAGPCNPPQEGCPCNFNGTPEGVCGTAVYGADGECAEPVGFQNPETSCDEVDNDCDGVTDEPCADGAPCDDGDPCTVGDVWNNGECHGHPKEGCPCDFNGTPEGVCGTAVYDADGVCAVPAGFQNPETSCDDVDNNCDGVTDEPCADGAPCDDGDPCTVGDVWNSGECHGHPDESFFAAGYGGPGDDQLASLKRLPDGGFVLAGSTTAEAGSNPDAWLVRTDSTGGVQWEQTYGSPLKEEWSDVIVLSNGGLAMVGYTTTSGGAGKSDGWLMTTNANGGTWSSTQYGGTNYDYLHSVAELPNNNNDGGFIMAGRTLSSGQGLNDVWLVRTEANGTEVWENTYGGPLQEDAYSVMPQPDGGFVVAGYTQSKGNGADDGWLLRTQSDGTLDWDHTFGGPQPDRVYDAVALSEGGFALAGGTQSTGEGGWDFWLVLTDFNGGSLGEYTYGGSNDDVAYAIAALPDGGFALAGSTQSTGAGGKDLWLVRTDANGAMLWSKTMGGAEDDWASSLVALPGGGFALGGKTSSQGAGLSDFWLVRTDDQGLCP